MSHERLRVAFPDQSPELMKFFNPEGGRDPHCEFEMRANDPRIRRDG
jgi:hypothetical protein